MSENRRIHLRIGTAAEWATHNPVLALGEPGYISDTRILRIGDGTTVFASLADFNIPNDYIVPVVQGGTGSDNAIDARTALGLDSMAVQAASAVAITGGTIDLLDSQKIRLGTGNDLEILHDGSNSYLREVGTGGLIIGGSAITFVSQNLLETLMTLVQNGAAALYYDAAKKLETTSTGVSITGDVVATGFVSALTAILTGQFSSGVNGTDFPTVAFAALVLNTEVQDAIGVSLASNQITFATAGTYLIEGYVMPYNASGNGRSAQIRLFDVTGAAVIAVGQTMNTQSSALGAMSVAGVATVTAGGVVELQGIASGSALYQSYGASFGAHAGPRVSIQRIG